MPRAKAFTGRSPQNDGSFCFQTPQHGPLSIGLPTSLFPENSRLGALCAQRQVSVSAVSALPEIRAALLSLQRRLINSAERGIVVEGRDIGTVVAPEAGLKIYLDPATVGGMAGVPIAEIRAWINQVHCLLLNEDETKYLSSTTDLELAIADLLQICPTIVVKRGSHGVIAANRGSASISLPAISAQVIDTTGAGDSFAAGFIAADQAGLDFTQSLGAALTIAAKCVAIVGARPALDAQV